MTVESLAPVRALVDHRLLEQFLITCPGCEKPAAVHVDRGDLAAASSPVVVRVVCPDGCIVGDADVLGRLPSAASAAASAEATLSA